MLTFSDINNRKNVELQKNYEELNCLFPKKMSNKTTFQDFCLAWKSRFPQSELPAAWEEDVRSNLAKHKAKVESLR